MDINFNAADWLVDRQVREGRGEAVAVDAAAGRLTYAELVDVTGQVAAGLRALGTRQYDRVAFVARDDIPMFAGILGAIRAGFVAVPINSMLHAHELSEIIRDSGASVVVASEAYAQRVLDAIAECPEVTHVVWDGEPAAEELLPDGVGSSTFAELLAAGAAGRPAHREAIAAGDDSWALWLYTSGTTGKPKGAMHRHLNLRLVAELYGHQVLGITPQDRCLSVAKLFFAYGIGNSMFFPLSVGATSVLEAELPAPETMARRIRSAQPTLFFSVPTFYAGLLASDVPDDLFEGVRLGVSAGEALPEVVQERMKLRFGLDILDGIGSTETLHIFLSNRPGDIRPGTSGRPVPGYELELRDSFESKVPDGEPGNLFVRGRSVALGYWRRVEETRYVFRGEWVNTGDMFVRTPDGHYCCHGRANDLLKAGGIWVSPLEVERRLLGHQAVEECAVVAWSDENGLEKPVACVTTRSAVSEKELDAWCREGLAAFKRPRRFFFLQSLPKTTTGKVQRYRLRELVQQLVAQGEDSDAESGSHGGAAATSSAMQGVSVSR